MVYSVCTINLEVLSKEDCWSIISKIAFFEKDGKQREQLEYLGRELANNCKGLPLTAKTLGSLMWDKRSREEWKNILDSNLWELEDVHKGLLGPLLLSFYELSSAIKQCFLYCAEIGLSRVCGISVYDTKSLGLSRDHRWLCQEFEMLILIEGLNWNISSCIHDMSIWLNISYH